MQSAKFGMRLLGIASALAVLATSVLAEANDGRLRVRRSARTGLATFVTTADGGPIPLRRLAGPSRPQPEDFLTAHGNLFGVVNPEGQLVVGKARQDTLGHTHTTYRQVHRDVPVFSGVIKVHQNAGGAVLAANGDFYPIPEKLNTLPTLPPNRAVAQAHVALGEKQLPVERSELVIVDPGWYGDPPIGPHLAYYIILSDPSVPVRQAFFIDAHTGRILDQWNLLEAALDRAIWNDDTGAWARFEGQPPTGDFDVDAAYDFSGDMYGFLYRGFGRDALDGAGSSMIATVHLVSSSCPNAFGGGGQAWFCDGLVTDDIVAHEWGHSLTEFTAGLIYQNQPGQLNESYSDVWGELVDLFNGDAAFAGAPGGTPWPMDATHVGPGTDTPNGLRSAECVTGVRLEINLPPEIAGVYLAASAYFGPPLSEIGVTGDVAAAEPTLACGSLTNPAAVAGKIALIDRGSCAFTVKVKNAQNAGASAVIIANNIPGPPIALGGDDPTVTIPSGCITQDDGAMIRSALTGGSVNATLAANSSTGGVRWLTGEDSSGFGGPIRDMWEPTCFWDPDRANHPFQTCSPADDGGVHSGSGIPNHAFAILTDGKTFNGYTVNGIGPIKAGAVWYRALTTYLTAVSDFEDAYVALNQAAADLVGTSVIDPRDGSVFGTFTLADAAEVDKALLAVEMNTEGLCGATGNILDSTPPEQCDGRNIIYFDDFEGGAAGWTVSNSGPSGPPTPYDWVRVSGGLPFGWPGTVWYADDPNIGDCNFQDESAVHSLFSPVITLPADVPALTLAFAHFVETELWWDGGNLKISVNGGPFQLIPGSAFLYNSYNSILATSAQGNTNPIAGEEAWTGVSMEGGQWGTSLVDLGGFAAGGDQIQLGFDFGKDGCSGITGWFVDDVEVYTCPLPIEDCNGNGVEDSEDILLGTSDDCDENSTPDECEIDENSTAPGGPFFCTSNCDPDCNNNGIPDDCETALAPSISQHPNGQTVCAGQAVTFTVAAGSFEPPSFQWRKDGGEIPGATQDFYTIDPVAVDDAGEYDVVVTNSCGSVTSDAAGLTVPVPDPPLAEPTVVDVGFGTRNRYLAWSGGTPGESEAARVQFNVGGNMAGMWVGEPEPVSESSGDSGGAPPPTVWAATLQCDPHFTDWTQYEVIHVYHQSIVPSLSYEIAIAREGCGVYDGGFTLTPLVLTTSAWGDVAGVYDAGSCTTMPNDYKDCWTAPDGDADFDDITSIVDKFRNLPGSPMKSRVDIAAQTPDKIVDFVDIPWAVDAFRGLPYSFPPPDAPCP